MMIEASKISGYIYIYDYIYLYIITGMWFHGILSGNFVLLVLIFHNQISIRHRLCMVIGYIEWCHG